MIDSKPFTLAALSRYWPMAALIITAIDLLGLFGYMGRREYLLNPIWIYLFLYAVAFLLYVYAAGRIVPALPARVSRLTVLIVVVFAVLYRLSILTANPSISTDMYRYVWDGRLSAHGINPYHWTPYAGALWGLRDSVWERMEYKPYYTIYMPVSQIVFAFCNLVFGSNLIGYKAIYVLCDLGVMAAVLRLLRAYGRPLTNIIWYAWCPLPITEVALAGHQDVIGVLFLLLTFLLVRHRQTMAPAAVALVASVLTKGFALILLPVFCRMYGRRFAVSAALALVYLGMPMWVYLPEFLHGMTQYLDTVHVNSGLFHFLDAGLSPLTGYHYQIAKAITDGIIVGAVVWSAYRKPADEMDVMRRSFIVLSITILVVPTLFSWYLLWLLPLACVVGRRPSWAFILLTGLVVLLYTYYISMETYTWTPIAEYVPFYIVLALEFFYWRGGRRDIVRFGQARSPNATSSRSPRINERLEGSGSA